MKTVRESGAKTCLKNVRNYVESVVYSDAQRFWLVHLFFKIKLMVYKSCNIFAVTMMKEI